jgi:lipopolysaccharide/colanic/teichoic acid biosynthesis glycosyltransferase
MATKKEFGQKYGSIGVIVIEDVVLSAVASLLAILLVRWLSDPIPGFSTLLFKWEAFALVAVVLAFSITRTWRDVRRYFTARSSARLVLAAGIKDLLLGFVLLIGWIRLPSSAYAVMAVLSDFLLTSFFLLASRFAARQLAREPVRVQDSAQRKTALVVGTGESSLRLAAELESTGLYTVVALTTRDRGMAGRVVADRLVCYLENNHDIDQLQWRLGGIDCIFFPKDRMADEDEEETAPGSETGTDDTQEFHADAMSAAGHLIKHAFDLLVSGILIILFSPLALICAIAVKLGDGGPVIYAQERIGLHGKPFKIYKFRTMRTDAEAAGVPELAEGEEDPRLTRVGRFLRAHHLDELPQLWNVFKGDMSFIGYRPERAYYIDKIMERNPRYRFLYQMRPGITSYATLYNGYTSTLEKMLTRLDMDLYYLRTRSVWTDIRVLGLTFLRIVAGKRF